MVSPLLFVQIKTPSKNHLVCDSVFFIGFVSLLADLFSHTRTHYICRFSNAAFTAFGWVHSTGSFYIHRHNSNSQSPLHTECVIFAERTTWALCGRSSG